jgi:hypothetical protein
MGLADMVSTPAARKRREMHHDASGANGAYASEPSAARAEAYRGKTLPTTTAAQHYAVV